MSLNKIHFDFELSDEGWLSFPPTEEDAYRGVIGSKVAVRVTEYSHDEKPDIWYKAHILNLCDDAERKAEMIAKLQNFGMPTLMKQTCWADTETIERVMIRQLESC